MGAERGREILTADLFNRMDGACAGTIDWALTDEPYLLKADPSSGVTLAGLTHKSLTTAS